MKDALQNESIISEAEKKGIYGNICCKKITWRVRNYRQLMSSLREKRPPPFLPAPENRVL